MGTIQRKKEVSIINYFYWEWETHEDISRVKLEKSRVARKPPILFPICSFIRHCIVHCINWRELTPCRIRMDPGSGDLGEIVYSGLPGNTVGMATMVDMSEASKQKSA